MATLVSLSLWVVLSIDIDSRQCRSMEDPEQRVMQALKSAPFVVFAKEAPNSLDDFSMDEAFTYFYFSDVMHTFSGLDPSFLTVGRNAKTDFPEDYEAYFADDVDAPKHQCSHMQSLSQCQGGSIAMLSVHQFGEEYILPG